MDNNSEISTIYSSIGTITSESTIPGLGFLPGRAIKRLGEAVLNGVDGVLVNRQLNRIEARLKNDRSLEMWQETGDQKMCKALLEFTRPGYPFPVQMRALRIIRELIDTLNFKALAAALVEVKSPSTIHHHLSTIIQYLWSSGDTDNSGTATVGDSSTLTSEIAPCHIAGSEAYRTAFTSDHDTSSLSIVLYLAWVAAVGSRDHARTIFDLGITRFLGSTGLFEPLEKRSETVAARLLMHVLARKLDPTRDADAVASIINNISSISVGSTYLNEENSILESIGAEDSNLLEEAVLDAIEFLKTQSRDTDNSRLIAGTFDKLTVSAWPTVLPRRRAKSTIIPGQGVLPKEIQIFVTRSTTQKVYYMDADKYAHYRLIGKWIP